MALAAQPELTVPALGSHDVEAILGQAWSEPYAWVLGDGPDPVTHRFLGHPNPVQGDMQLECQLASHGVAVGDGDYLGLSRTAELAPGAADWRLLLQVDSEPAAAMMWGDVGRLYWWITHEHLAEGLWAVSYTHLDVYKRQLIARSPTERCMTAARASASGSPNTTAARAEVSRTTVIAADPVRRSRGSARRRCV